MQFVHGLVFDLVGERANERVPLPVRNLRRLKVVYWVPDMTSNTERLRRRMDLANRQTSVCMLTHTSSRLSQNDT
ncbi:hypothetical protein BaRGS_00000395, partial [Batillaria attramentaria]